MRVRFQVGDLAWITACACALLMTAPVRAAAQGTPQSGSSAPSQGAKQQQQSPDPKPCSVIPDPDPCGTTPKPPGAPSSTSAPSAADRFPFPGSGSADSPGIGGIPGPQQSAAPAEQPSTSPADTAKPADSVKKFPFPGAPSVPSAPSAPAPDAGSSSSSSSSDGDPADALPGDSPDLKDAGSAGTQTKSGGHILHRTAPPPPKPKTADEREAEDLQVAKFYLDSGDVKGAYVRLLDAVKTVPDDPEAHFALAELAAKLGKKDEAVAEYNACLKLDPTDKQKKDSSKALARLAK